MKELLQEMEIKGIPAYKICELLSKHGYQIFIRDPIPQKQYVNDFHLKRNRIAIQKALIEVRCVQKKINLTNFVSNNNQFKPFA